MAVPRALPVEPDLGARGPAWLDPVPSPLHGPRGAGSTPSAGVAGGPVGARVDAAPCRATRVRTSPWVPDGPLVSTNNKCAGRRRKSAKLLAREKANPPVEPPATAPKYVHACHAGEWHLNLRYKDGRPGARIPYRCNSRHHEGPCRDTWRRRLFARLKAGALGTANPADVLFATLTLPASDHAEVKAALRSGEISRVEAAVKEQNRTLGAKLKSWVDALSKRARREGGERLRYFWFREAHRSGVPHLHLLIVSPWVAARVRARDAELAELDVELDEDDRGLAPVEYRELAMQCGFGERLDMQVAESPKALMSYAAKVIGEVSKGSQTPEILPQHCRSYGASKGFLAPRETDERCVGWVTDEHGRVLQKHQLPEVEDGWDASGTAPRRATLALPDIEGVPMREAELAAAKAERLASSRKTKAGGVWDPDDASVPDQGTVEDGWRWAETMHLDAPKSRTYVLDRRPKVYRPPKGPEPPPEPPRQMPLRVSRREESEVGTPPLF